MPSSLRMRLSSARIERSLAESAWILVFILRAGSASFVKARDRHSTTHVSRGYTTLWSKEDDSFSSRSVCHPHKLYLRIAETATEGSCESISQGSELLWRCLL